MLQKLYRRRRQILMLGAALPLMQMGGGCDPVGFTAQIAAGYVNSAAVSLVQLGVSSIISTLLSAFPGSNLLRLLFVNGGVFPGV
ncbi:MAG: hypothetical protein U1A27_14140 [Phycisphaerae bacterium]